MIPRLRRKRKPDRPSRDQLMPPEGVPLTMQIAGVGVRLGAQITDIAITTAVLVCIMILLATLNITGPRTIVAIGALLFFLIRVPYYILAELAWNGQTLGKRIMKIKVVSHDGGPLTTHALVLRNMMKEAEVFLPATLVLTLDAEQLVPSLIALAWTAGSILVVVVNKRRRRLGDYMAGTYVIHLPDPVLLSDLSSDARAAAKGPDDIGFLTHQLEYYGAYELQTLEKILRAEERPAQTAAEKTRRAETLAAIVERIRAKIDYADAVPEAVHLKFLRAFYNAQRAHLEQKQIFGETRADKFHNQNTE